jgi:hypothetical protein
VLRFRSLLTQERQFLSYDDCPEVYYRFNSKGQCGPQKLDRIASFFAARCDENIEGRFVDEQQWRPLTYFLELWERILPSTRTISRLTRAGISSQDVTESQARKLLRDVRKAKPPTPRQIEYFRTAGIVIDEELSRGQAEAIIGARERTLSEERQRAEEAPEIQACIQRLEALRARVNAIDPKWHPDTPSDLASIICYEVRVEDALDHATRYDLVELQSGLFYDGLNRDSDYYLEFTQEPTAEDIRRFQEALFNAYVEAGSEEFDHLAILRRTLPMIRATLV